MNKNVWVFFPEEENARTRHARALLRKRIGTKQWTMQERSAKTIRTPGGGKLSIAEPRDVVALYRDAHRARVALLTAGKISFCYEPPEERAVRRDLTLKLQTYCQYKTFCGVLPSQEREVEEFLVDFQSWLNTVACDGDSDPRCLPFPTFKAKCSTVQLENPDERASFETAHHARTSRKDALGLEWGFDPRVFHGHETLTVAGRGLSPGFHWDVQNPDKGPVRLGTPLEIWKVDKYVNVFPDGTVRGRQPFAKKI